MAESSKSSVIFELDVIGAAANKVLGALVARRRHRVIHLLFG